MIKERGELPCLRKSTLPLCESSNGMRRLVYVVIRFWETKVVVKVKTIMENCEGNENSGSRLGVALE